MAAAEQEAGWSKPSNGLQAKLAFSKTDGTAGTPVITAYLELRNVSDLGSVMEVPLKLDAIKYDLHDETGKVVPPTGGSFDGASVPLGMLRLPYDSSLRFNISSHGAGIESNQAGLLELGPSSVWTFPSGDKHSYSLTAKITIEKHRHLSDNVIWSGIIEIPATLLPSLTK